MSQVSTRNINLLKLHLDKKILKSFPPEALAWIVIAGHISNEINFLRKLFIFTLNCNANDILLKRTQNEQCIFLIRELCGKIYEGWNITKKCISVQHYQGKLS